MNKLKQRIAIAEVCGWKWHGDASWSKEPDRFYWKTPDGLYSIKHSYQTLPDYPNDLNAMHEAENMLTAKQKIGYYMELALWRDDTGEATENLYEVVHATAEQRAEAFL